MTALGDLQDKVRAFEAGGDDYVTKPFQHEEVLARVRTHAGMRELQLQLAEANADLESKVSARTADLKTALGEVERLKNRLQQENRYLKQEICEQANHGEIVGTSPALRHALRQVALVAPTDSTVLIHGETGTGKELIARAIHERSPRRDRAMVKLNCSAISAGLVESELFGHVKGAFTGATDRRVGRFELADGGTLFLDEVSELPLDTQAKLLRVLQEGEFEPVGSSKSMRVNVRVIAATNRDLQADVAERPLPRRPVLSSERVSRSTCRRCASAARTSLRWRSSSWSACAASSASRCAASMPARSRRCRLTPGPATSATCRTPSSAPRSCRAATCCGSTGRWTPGRKAASPPSRRKRRRRHRAARRTRRPTAWKKSSASTSSRC